MLMNSATSVAIARVESAPVAIPAIASPEPVTLSRALDILRSAATPRAIAGMPRKQQKPKLKIPKTRDAIARGSLRGTRGTRTAA